MAIAFPGATTDTIAGDGPPSAPPTAGPAGGRRVSVGAVVGAGTAVLVAVALGLTGPTDGRLLALTAAAGAEVVAVAEGLGAVAELEELPHAARETAAAPEAARTIRRFTGVL